MEIQLKAGLKHQEHALTAINNVFDNVEIISTNNINQNPLINLYDPQIGKNIEKVQNGKYLEEARIIPAEWRTHTDNTDVLNIDVRMETGTGKTYVYTKMMYELHELYGFNKFIIIVPTTPIREGTSQFISSEFTKKNFADDYPNVRINLNVLEAQKQIKNRKKMFPVAVSSYTRGTRLEKNVINVLLVNNGMLLSKATMEKSDYDQTVLGSYTQPYKALEETKSIVIIDEPHRFKRENRAYKCILDKIKPQVIVRFGATFPELKNGTRDYDNLVYNLGSCESFNDRLIKGVEVNYPPEISEEDIPVRLIDINKSNPKTATFRNEITKKKYSVELNNSLSVISEKFNNIFLANVGKIDDVSNAIMLSNGQILRKNDIFYSNIYSATYQELMIKYALDEHFEKEKENFTRKNKVKTLALFFIDSRMSFRGTGKEDTGELRLLFEKLLTEKLKEVIKEVDEQIQKGDPLIEYKAYLQASLDNVRATNDGYFSDDNNSSDEEIRENIDMILRDKTKLLSIKNPDGSYNTFRFIFSQWALREGWDNPNVFTIAKLRSSGSDISKIQEVGRGLRLPVDEKGNRIENEQFYLSYIIDYSEKDFAANLIKEINSEVVEVLNIKELLKEVSSKRGTTEKQLFIELYSLDYIDTDYNVIEETRNQFLEEYPEFMKGLAKDKVIDKKKVQKPVVNIRADKFAELKELWLLLNKKYYIQFEEISDKDLKDVIINILSKGIYNPDIITTVKQRVEVNDGAMSLATGKRRTYKLNTKLPYNEFLKKIQSATNVPIQTFHAALVEYNKTTPISNDWFTESTLNKFIQLFGEWQRDYYIHRFKYKIMDIPESETALTDVNGNVKSSILQADVGIFTGVDDISDKFLYDKLIFDSPLEKKNIVSSDISEVLVYGKIPRRSIKIPVCFGGTYSPDFMYVIKNKDGSLQYNFVIETKDVSSNGALRDDEKKKILCGYEFFKQLEAEGYNVIFKEQVKTDNIVAMIKKIANL